jgi:2-polyprenyl-3-methyl-5-hydroxy-6-metoxy-1,4-benzoquinol methylase
VWKRRKPRETEAGLGAATAGSDAERERITAWFAERGQTDVAYLNAHYERFARTFRFAEPALRPGFTILDLGCHWLHQAWFFASRGYRMYCADVPNTLREPSVVRAAGDLGVQLVEYVRLDLAQGLSGLGSETADVVLMCEILEHLAFNPLVMWKQLYRVMRPSARIVLTTPNGAYYGSVLDGFRAQMATGRVGVDVRDVFEVGTFGHHWKEYSPPEIADYFRHLSSEFSLTRCDVATLGATDAEERESCARAANQARSESLPFDLRAVVDRLERAGCRPYGKQIFAEVSLEKRGLGISREPPWLVE